MGINAIQRSGQRKEDALDKIAKGLAIAKGIMDVGTGVADAVTTSDAEKLQKEQLTAMERANSNTFNAVDLAKAKLDPAKEGEQGAFQVNVMGVDGKSTPQWLKRGTDLEEMSRKLGIETARFNLNEKKKESDRVEASLNTSIGRAANPEEAKKVTDAVTSYRTLRGLVQQALDLRQKYGTEFWNADAIAAGEGISNAIAVEYKNLAQLGVLSNSDLELIRKQVPADLLQFERQSLNPLSSSSPTRTRLETFAGSIDDKFKNFAESRKLDPSSELAKFQRAIPPNSVAGNKPASSQAGMTGGKQPPNGQKTVIQDGNIYNWNPMKGTYE